MSKDDLITGQNSELRQGFNPSLKKFLLKSSILKLKII